MKKGLKSFLKYVLFGSFFSAMAVASPIASPGTSTVYSGTNSSLLYSPTVTSGSGSGSACDLALLRPILVDQTNPGAYIRTVDLSSFANCGSDVMLVIKAAGGSGGGQDGINNTAGLGGITILRIPLSTFLQEYGTQVTFYYLVGAHGNNGGYAIISGAGGYGGGGSGNGINIYTSGSGGSWYGGGGGGASLVSLNNWPWNGGELLAVGGGGGGNGGGYGNGIGYGGGGGGGNDCGQNGGGDWYIGAGGGGGGGCDGVGGAGGAGGSGQYWIGEWLSAGGAGGSGSEWYGGNGGNGYLSTYSGCGGGGGGGGYGGGGGGGGGNGGPDGRSAGGYGGGGGGYCNTSLGSCQASDWTNGGGNSGPGYVEIYIKNGREIPINTTLP